MAERYYSGTTITDILQQEIDNADLLSRILSRLKYAEDDCADGGMISRQAAIDDVHRQIWYRMNPSMRDRIDKWLKALPPVQPEIIRCRDCKYCDPMTKQGYTFDWCKTWDREIESGEEFCSKAERREDADR